MKKNRQQDLAEQYNKQNRFQFLQILEFDKAQGTAKVNQSKAGHVSQLIKDRYNRSRQRNLERAENQAGCKGADDRIYNFF